MDFHKFWQVQPSWLRCCAPCWVATKKIDLLFYREHGLSHNNKKRCERQLYIQRTTIVWYFSGAKENLNESFHSALYSLKEGERHVRWKWLLRMLGFISPLHRKLLENESKGLLESTFIFLLMYMFGGLGALFPPPPWPWMSSRAQFYWEKLSFVGYSITMYARAESILE
jgi:hypothetical protein